MIVHAIQTELARLQVHPVNLTVVSGTDDGLVTLTGSLLRYWVVPPNVDGPWLLAELQGLPDAAGPEGVMNWIVAAYGKQGRTQEAAAAGTQLRVRSPDRNPCGAAGSHQERELTCHARPMSWRRAPRSIYCCPT
jgi:hypothetical protein